jgi:fermentation-respiration switch protein FrsA (DUF1100 family)
MPALGGVVLQSTFASGLRVVFGPGDACAGCCAPTCVFAPFDPYRNVRALRRVNAPVLVMHGEDDEVVEFWHGQAVHEAASRRAAALDREPVAPYFVPRAGHNNLVETDHVAYFERVRTFVQERR